MYGRKVEAISRSIPYSACPKAAAAAAPRAAPLPPRPPRPLLTLPLSLSFLSSIALPLPCAVVGVGNHVRAQAIARPPTPMSPHALSPLPTPTPSAPACPPRAQEQVWWGGAPFRARWTMPPALNPLTRQPLPAATTANRSFYGLAIGAPGALHFAMFDTESVLDVSDVSAANVAWLKEELAVAAAGGAKWLVTGGHRPLYCTNGGFNGGNKDCKGMSETLRAQVEATFAGVDLVLGSHMHGYERTRPIKAGAALPGNGTNAVGAPVYIVNGAGGNREGNEDPKGDAPWSAPGAHSGAFGYGLLTIAASAAPGASSLQYQFVESATGRVLDALTLTK